MTQEQWDKLEPENIIQYDRERYKLFCKDSFMRWVVEKINYFNDPLGFKVLKPKDNQISKFEFVR